MKNLIYQIHLWLGLISGLVVFFISITGCIYVFEDEIKSWVYHDRYHVEVPPNVQKKPVSELLTIAATLSGSDHPIQSVSLSTDPDRSYSFRPEQIRNKEAFTHFGEIVYQHNFFLNPYTGELIKDEDSKYEFFNLVLRFHRNLLLNRQVGKMIIGSSVLMFVVLLISGLVLWWPKNKKAAKQRYWFRWKSTTQWKRKNYDLHNILGFYSLFILLAIALTGLVWSFDWVDDSIQWLANGGKSSERREQIFSESIQNQTDQPIDQALIQTMGLTSDNAISIRLPHKDKDVIRVITYNEMADNYQRQEYLFDQYSSQLLKSSGFDDKSGGEKLRAMNYDIHVGKILGLPGQLLAFFAALISASLPITGFLMWLGRKKKEKVKSKKKLRNKLSNQPPATMKKPKISRLTKQLIEPA